MGELVGVFTQPDRPTGRGQQIVPNEIKRWAQAKSLPIYQPQKLTEDVRLQLTELRPDLALVMAYGHILRDAFIQTPRLGTLNLHASILPRYRGASPIQSAIAAGEKETGVTLMRIVRQLDAGPVADLERVCIEPLDTAVEIEKKLSLASVPLVARTLPKLREGTLNFVTQNDAEATFCRRLQKSDGAIDFHASARVLAARINGLYPWPGCSIEVAGQKIKLGLAASGSEKGGAAPGMVLAHDQESVRIATSQGVLRLLRLQRPGGRMLTAPEFLRGFPIEAGIVLASEPMPELMVKP